MKMLVFITAYFAAVLLPLFVSYLVGGPPRPLRLELASGLGILAFAMILAEFVLSGRFKSVSNGVGMDVTMRLHQMMARTALVFAMLHPFLFQGSPSGGARPWDTSRQLTLTTDFTDLSTGIAAFVLLPCLVLFAIGRTQLDFKYETWRLMHGIGAILIALLLLHHTVYAGRYGSQPVMTWIWVAMTVIAVGSLLYVYFLEPLGDKARGWRVKSVHQRAPQQWELTVTPDAHSGFDYKAGQFAWLNVGHSAFSLHENPFSISSAPSDGPDVSFLIKELGDFTRTVGQIETGTRAYLDGPYGHMTVQDRHEPGIALIAGGVGVAPMLGILRDLRLRNDPREVKMIYANRAEQQIVCRQELEPENVTYVLSDPPADWAGETGFIDAVLMDRVFTPDQYTNWVFVICGPPIMMDIVEDILIAKGTPASQILSERFNYD